MQLRFELNREEFHKIADALCEDRILRYKAASVSDHVSPLALYVWNCAISEAFYVSLHFAEIVCRNALHEAMVSRAGPEWYKDSTFRNLLGDRFRVELDTAIEDESRQHSHRMNGNHIVSALSFGFWEHLTTKRFERMLFPKGITEWFPNARYGASLHNLNELIQKVRRWRNRIAHHRAIFDKGPMKKHDEALQLIRWRCSKTVSWVSEASRVPAVIQARPKRSENSN